MPRPPLTVLVMAAVSLGCEPVTAPVPLGWGETRVYTTHREVALGWKSSDGATLSGTLILPRSPGRYAALVIHMGSDRWTRLGYESVRGWVDLGVAVFTYDKRGVGASEGRCCPFAEEGYFSLLADDVLSSARAVREHPEVRRELVGAWGFSQGGWVVPVAAAKGGGDIAFSFVGSGPTVPLSEELLFSALTGEDKCTPTGRSAAEIEATLEAATPSGFDPKPFLEQLTVPALWIYGGEDLSIPVERSVRVIREIRGRLGRDFSDTTIAGINHSWIVHGGICQRSGGQVWIDGPVTIPWLDARFPGWRVR